MFKLLIGIKLILPISKERLHLLIQPSLISSCQQGVYNVYSAYSINSLMSTILKLCQEFCPQLVCRDNSDSEALRDLPYTYDLLILHIQEHVYEY